MGYSVIISSRAQKEIENAIDFYALNSADAPKNFISQLKEVYDLLAINPFYRIRYKNVRAVALKKFPHYLYYIINAKEQIVRILSCFHGRRNPNARP